MATVELSLDNTEKSLRTSPETNFRLIQAFNRSTNNFGEIHVSQRLDWAFLSHSFPLILLIDYRYINGFTTKVSNSTLEWFYLNRGTDTNK